MRVLKYSRQREFIKSSLAQRYDHPTADMLYTSIRKEFPNISLGTVYRNLNLLAEIGEIQKLNFGGGADHFDAKITPHYHFICKCCQQVSDLPMAPLAEITTLAQRYYGGRIDSHSTNFYGICENCVQSASNPCEAELPKNGEKKFSETLDK